MLSSTLPLAVVGATVVGFAVGFNVGATVVGATVVGATVVGFTVGFNVGATVVGATVGLAVGATVVGATVVGATVGLTVVLSFFLVVSVLVVFTSALVVTICEGSLFVVT